MKTIYGIIAHTVFALTLTLSQTAAASADNTQENTGIHAAMKLYSQALPLDIDSPKRAELLDQSASILQNVIENNPESLEAHRKLMGVYLLKQDYSNGIRTMQSAITLSPEDPKLFITLAFLYEHSGAFEYAKAMLNQALALDPNQKIAKEYKIVIQQKIDALNMDQLHKGKKLMGANHGKPADTTHPPIDPK
ncbi:tetratricopeptide repeat protein [endosymbiont of Ridgeia piscesae]|jgi:Flp pilus assembly protein TadD|uniref:TPR repeat n=1 Tax=endosymbiont of Ridgeia piscesae TaxID=54398 RepID=A0A0T5ZB64_9GAMM|nr:tetratricopeptide repeat protein [endosymbiont of Ridgeia piscesae]KRT55979.1 TPR repeat [endosymbiont of Ridgeia piscesae]KRT60096.1 Tetratricopeptide repeat-containing protein [endosymbiont of Ridgeia piscesae]